MPTINYIIQILALGPSIKDKHTLRPTEAAPDTSTQNVAVPYMVATFLLGTVEPVYITAQSLAGARPVASAYQRHTAVSFGTDGAFS